MWSYVVNAHLAWPWIAVLFLALSSHGSKDWAVSVTNGALPLNDLKAAELASLLKEAGIKWRMIVISCYAGGFIDM